MKCGDSFWKKLIFLSVLFNEAVNCRPVFGEMVLMGVSRSNWKQTYPSDSILRQIQNKVFISL